MEVSLLSNEKFSNSFSDIIKDRGDRISTGFRNLDEVLNGGLSLGQLIVLGAEPGAGKTAFISQIAENLATAGNPVFFFTLEMSRFELQARGIARQSYLLKESETFSAGEIMGFKDDGGQMRKLEISDYQSAFDKYFENTGKNLYIIENIDGGLSASDILEIVEENIENFEKKPVIIVDYLQILTDRQETDRKSKVDNSIKALKYITTKYNLPVLCISSTARSSYSDDVHGITLSSFKESGDIEYNANVVLGLNRGKSNKGIRNVKIDVLKNKNGRAGSQLDFCLYESVLHFAEKDDERPALII